MTTYKIAASISARTWQVVGVGALCACTAIYRHDVEPRAFDTLRVIGTVAALALFARSLIWIRRAYTQRALLLRHVAHNFHTTDSEVVLQYRGSEWRLTRAMVLEITTLAWAENQSVHIAVAPHLPDGFVILTDADKVIALRTWLADADASPKTLTACSIPYHGETWMRAPFASLSLGITVVIEWFTHRNGDTWFPLLAALLCAVPFVMFLQLAKPWQKRASTWLALEPEYFDCVTANIARLPWSTAIDVDGGSITVRKDEPISLAWASLIPMAIGTALLFAYQRAASQNVQLFSSISYTIHKQ